MHLVGVGAVARDKVGAGIRDAYGDRIGEAPMACVVMKFIDAKDARKVNKQMFANTNAN